MRHLECLVAVYSLGGQASAPDKSRAWNALACAERDLEKLHSASSRSCPAASAVQLVHSTRLGLVEARKGGLPMRIRYFLPPYHLVNKEASQLIEPT